MLIDKVSACVYKIHVHKSGKIQCEIVMYFLERKPNVTFSIAFSLRNQCKQSVLLREHNFICDCYTS